MIDNETEKLQTCLENSFLSKGYTAEDILGLPNLIDGRVRDENWQRAYMAQLGDLVETMLDRADNVPAYLASDALTPDQRPKDLVPVIEKINP